LKQGVLRKRGGRMSRWLQRQFYLKGGGHLCYKQESSKEGMTSFDLCPGCIVTDVQEEKSPNPLPKQANSSKLYSFWVIWPRDKNVKDEVSGNNSSSRGIVGDSGGETKKQNSKDNGEEEDSDEEAELSLHAAAPSKALVASAAKDLKLIVQGERDSKR